MERERDIWERAALDEEQSRRNSEERVLEEVQALNNQLAAIRWNSGASIGRLQDTVRRLEARVASDLEVGDRLRHEVAHLRTTSSRDDSLIELLRHHNTILQRRVEEHEAAELRHLHQLNEQRDEIYDLRRELGQMIQADRVTNTRIRGMLRESSDRERETAGKLEKSNDLVNEMWGELEDASALELILKEENNTLVEQVRVLSEENRRLTGLVDTDTPSPDDTSTSILADDTDTPITADGTGTPSPEDTRTPSPDYASTATLVDDIGASRPSSQASRRLSIQADPELAAIDARMEHDFYNGSDAEDSGYEAALDSEDENNGVVLDQAIPVPRPERQANRGNSRNSRRDWQQQYMVRLRPLERMRLPPIMAAGVAGAIEGEEQQDEDTMVLRSG